MGILFHCQQCERPLNVADRFAGQPGRCPNCRQSIAVPKDSEIVKAEFQTRLNAWSKRQVGDQDEGAMIDFVPVGQDEPNGSESPPVNKTKKEKTATVAAPVVTLKPIDVGGVTSIATDSQRVGDGLSAKFSASAPDLLNESGHATWYVRPPSGGQFGPASARLLRQWIHEGRVTGDSFIWCQGWDNWQPAGDVFPAIAGKLSPDSISAENPDAVTATRTRTAYMKARKRRTMRNMIGLLIGTIVVVALIIVLFMVVKEPA